MMLDNWISAFKIFNLTHSNGEAKPWESCMNIFRSEALKPRQLPSRIEVARRSRDDFALTAGLLKRLDLAD